MVELESPFLSFPSYFEKNEDVDKKLNLKLFLEVYGKSLSKEI
jgi:hypothetical protein